MAAVINLHIPNGVSGVMCSNACSKVYFLLHWKHRSYKPVGSRAAFPDPYFLYCSPQGFDLTAVSSCWPIRPWVFKLKVPVCRDLWAKMQSNINNYIFSRVYYHLKLIIVAFLFAFYIHMWGRVLFMDPSEGNDTGSVPGMKHRQNGQA